MPPSSTTLCIYVDRCIPSLQTPDAWSVSIGTCAYVHTGDDDGMGREENEWTRDRLAVGILGQSGGGSPFGIRGPSRRGFWRTQPNTVLHDMCRPTLSSITTQPKLGRWSRREYDDDDDQQPGLSSTSKPTIASYPLIAPRHHRLTLVGGARIKLGGIRLSRPTQYHHHHHRSISSSTPSRPSILPAFERFEPPRPPTTSDRSHDLVPHHLDRPLIILHGLFGSKQNWRSLAKKLSQLTQQTVFTLDLRNHGHSPSTPGLTSYSDYASDVKNFITSLKLQNVSLMGHSMGGKVAMTVALEDSNESQSLEPNRSSSPIRKLIVIDIAPAKGFSSDRFKGYLDGFREINSSSVSSRKQADEILSKYEDDISARQFLLTNLKRVELQDGGEGVKYEIRLPIEVLQHQISTNQIGDFPFLPNLSPTSSSSPEQLATMTPVRFKNPTLFIKGAKSKYINKHNIPAIDALFEDFEIITLDTGHWVHAERPHEFIESVTKFLND